MYSLSTEIMTLKVEVTKKYAKIQITQLQLFIDRNLGMLFLLAYRPLTLGDQEGHTDVTGLFLCLIFFSDMIKHRIFYFGKLPRYSPIPKPIEFGLNRPN